MKIVSTYITLENLRFHAHHGALPQERVTGGDFVVTVRVKCDIGRAAETDNVADTINYAELYRVVSEEMNVPSALLEHVAGRIGRRILTEFGRAEQAQVCITKRNPPMGADCDGAMVELTFNK
ncbi:MAG: dihydroneopterin aldolase [Prevotella sp.]|nr:dihydroneopterin aldolase [Prevotella sp.]